MAGAAFGDACAVCFIDIRGLLDMDFWLEILVRVAGYAVFAYVFVGFTAFHLWRKRAFERTAGA